MPKKGTKSEVCCHVWLQQKDGEASIEIDKPVCTLRLLIANISEVLMEWMYLGFDVAIDGVTLTAIITMIIVWSTKY